MMKQWLYLVFLGGLFFGCERPEKKDRIGKIYVLSTIAMIDDLVAQIGDTHVFHTTLIRGEIDPHTYELVKGDDEKFATADLIFYNGLGLEHGYSLRHNLENNPKAIALGDILLENEKESILKVDDQYDPHIWMDISLWTKIVDPIVYALSQKDPKHAENYARNGLLLKEKMLQLDGEIKDRLKKIPSEKRFLVTSHNAFHYFVRHYLAETHERETSQWQDRLSAPEGLAPDAELSSHDIQRVLDYITRHNINVIFSESNVNKEALRKIVSVGKKKGLNLRLSEKELYADAMGSSSYLEMISQNTQTLITEFERP